MAKPDLFSEMNTTMREGIPKQPGFENWVLTMPPRVRELFHAVMEGDVTPALIRSARKLPEQEWQGFTFVQAIANGNPALQVRLNLTNVVLWQISLEVESFNEDAPGE